YSISGRDPSTQGWTASEQLKAGDAQYLAFVHGTLGIDIRRIAWNSDTTAFTLGPPSTATVDWMAVPSGHSLARLTLLGSFFFGRGAVLGVDLVTSMRIHLAIYDLLGRQIRTLVDENLPRGRRVVNWTGHDRDGVLVPHGVYFARI